MTRRIRLTPLTLVLLLGASLAQEAGAYEDAANGRQLAERWCASCHLVSADQKQTLSDVPPFATIAKRSDEELSNLSGLLADPHPKMPEMNLTRQEITDLLAYIRSLR